MSVCKTNIKLGKQTAKKIKAIIESKKTKYESAGCFYVTYEKDGTVLLVLNDDIEINGDKEEVSPPTCTFTFHTHPRVSYEHYNDKIGWPSSSDYITFLHTVKTYGAAFHLVLTLEGVYCICLGKTWVSDIKSLDMHSMEKAIGDKYTVNKNKVSLEEYIQYINSVKYKGKELISLLYLDWKDILDGKTFQCEYPSARSCNLTNDRENYKEPTSPDVLKYRYNFQKKDMNEVLKYYNETRHISGYNMFFKEHVKIFRKQHPRMQYVNIVKKIGKTWREMSDRQKQNWDYRV